MSLVLTLSFKSSVLALVSDFEFLALALALEGVLDADLVHLIAMMSNCVHTILKMKF